MGDTGEKIKVWFRFVPREGWSPQDTEGVWGDTSVVAPDHMRAVSRFLEKGPHRR
ncbi:hypothetical protein ACWGJB_45580 [Streptomyces sp. NPDC054813]